MMELDTATEILDSFNPKTVDEYKRGFRRMLERTKRKEKPQDKPLVAGIDCGRWQVNCVCGSGIALHPRWQYAACLGCGRSWTKVIFPSQEQLDELEKVFRARPPGHIRKDPRRFWSWWPEETVDDLKRENAVRGWPESTEIADGDHS